VRACARWTCSKAAGVAETIDWRRRLVALDKQDALDPQTVQHENPRHPAQIPGTTSFRGARRDAERLLARSRRSSPPPRSLRWEKKTGIPRRGGPISTALRGERKLFGALNFTCAAATAPDRRTQRSGKTSLLRRAGSSRPAARCVGAVKYPAAAGGILAAARLRRTRQCRSRMTLTAARI